jgi:hypothetical protein
MGYVSGSGGQSTDDEDQAIGVQRRRLVDGALIVVNRRRPPGRIDSRKHAAAAETCHTKPILRYDAGSFRQTNPLHLITPGGDRNDILLQAGLDRLAHIILLANGRKIDGKSVDRHCLILPKLASADLLR